MRLTGGEENPQAARGKERKGKGRREGKGRNTGQIHWQLADTLGRGNRPELFIKGLVHTVCKVYQDVCKGTVQTHLPYRTRSDRVS